MCIRAKNATFIRTLFEFHYHCLQQVPRRRCVCKNMSSANCAQCCSVGWWRELEVTAGVFLMVFGLPLVHLRVSLDNFVPLTCSFSQWYWKEILFIFIWYYYCRHVIVLARFFVAWLASKSQHCKSNITDTFIDA